MEGKVIQFLGQSSDLPDSAVVDCLVDEYRKLLFPPPKGGIVTVEYPLSFSP